MTLQEKLYTDEAFQTFVNRPENENRHFELFDGVIYEMPSATAIHGWIALRIAFLLLSFVEPRRLGYVLGDSNDYVLAPGIIFQPDASFISKERLPKLPKRIHAAPDIAVEVVSPGNPPYDMMQKIETYLAYGTQLVWAIYPEEKVVRIYRSTDDGGIYSRKLTSEGGDQLDGENVLAGFSVPVKDLFPGDDEIESE